MLTRRQRQHPMWHPGSPAVVGTRRPAAFTLVEVLVATAVTLLLMAIVVSIFSYVSEGMAESRAIMEMSDQLRNAKHQLQCDLSGATAPTIPPLNPAANLGYFEYVEGPIGPVTPQYTTDSSLGDPDDILMFTACSLDRPFIGRNGSWSKVTESRTAEICWFMRGTTLYRRVLLVKPDLSPASRITYRDWDLSIRAQGGEFDRTPLAPGIDSMKGQGGRSRLRAVPNSLGDLTKRENRYGHQPLVFPHDVRFWNTTSDGRPGLGLPTLYESSVSNWPLPLYEVNDGRKLRCFMVQSPLYPNDPYAKLIVPSAVTTNSATAQPPITDEGFLLLQAKSAFNPYLRTRQHVAQINSASERLSTFNSGSNRAEADVMLRNVLSFDVKAWDPGAPVFRVIGDPGDPAGSSALIIPGDYGYTKHGTIGALQDFASNRRPNEVQLAGFGAYVDLNYMCRKRNNTATTATVEQLYVQRLAALESQLLLEPGTFPRPHFGGPGDPRSGLRGTEPFAGTNPPAGIIRLASTYCTWSTHYESDGIDQDADGNADQGANGIDDGGIIGVIDDPLERETAPPYEKPLRGIQVKIRCYEPDTRQVREVTLVHDFLPE